MECASKKEKVYRPRHPEKTPFYSVLIHHFDRFVGEYDLHFEKHYGKWRAVIASVVAKYLDCGMLKNGFARIRCPTWGEDGTVIGPPRRAHLQYKFEPLPLAAARPPPDTPPEWDSFSAD